METVLLIGDPQLWTDTIETATSETGCEIIVARDLEHGREIFGEWWSDVDAVVVVGADGELRRVVVSGAWDSGQSH